MSNKDTGANWTRAGAVLWHFVCWVPRKDPEILARMPTIFRFQVYSNALLLFTVAGIAFMTWGAFFSQFFPIWIVVPLTLLAVTWLIILDQTMASCDWSPKGVLRERNRVFVFNAVFFFRLVIAVVTSFATSYSAMMVLNSKAIAEQIQKHVDQQNNGTQIEADKRKDALRREKLGAYLADKDRAADALRVVAGDLTAARQRREDAAKERGKQERKRTEEILGAPGHVRGDGVNAKLAQSRRKEAEEEFGRMESDIRILEDRRAAAERILKEAVDAYHARETAPDLQRGEADIDQWASAQKASFHIDPILSFQAMQAILEDKERGPATQHYWHLILALLLLVEVSYVVANEYLSHANPHDAWLEAITKAESERAKAHHVEERARIMAQTRGTIEGLYPRAADRSGDWFRVVPRLGQSTSEV